MSHKLTDEQKKIIAHEGDLVISAVAGSGKCLGEGTPVMLYDGSIVNVEDVKPDDLLMGPDFNSRRVLSTNTGRGLLYRIIPETGDSWVCNDVHVMTLYGRYEEKLIDIPLNEFFEKYPISKYSNIHHHKLVRLNIPKNINIEESSYTMFFNDILSWKAKEIGEGEYFGFTLEGDGRFLLGDGTITHNTSTLIEYAKARPDKQILFLAFNKSIADEAASKFRQHKLKHVLCKTTHSLAYKAMGIGREYKLGYNPNPYFIGKDLFGLNMRKIETYKTVAHAVSKFTIFCDSDYNSIGEMDYLSDLVTDESKAFYLRNKKKVDSYSKQIWDAMSDGKLDVSHNWYLKAYQLRKPKLNYDIVMIDEGQDLSPVQLDIFKNQDGTKIIVGDSAQAIYSWRGAIDALEKFDFQRLHLTNSFRFSNDIAMIALEILATKEQVKPGYDPSSVKLTGVADFYKSVFAPVGSPKAYISRSNSKLLDLIMSIYKGIESVYIEGGLDSLFVSPSSGIHIFDILNLYIDKKEAIKNGFVKAFDDFQEFEDYAKDMDERNILDFIKIVKRYKKSLFYLSADIQPKLVEKASEADAVFSTIHKAKGLEYDHVEILSDYEEFPPPLLYRAKDGRPYTPKEMEAQIKQIIEEINIMYVGVTRAKKTVYHTIPGISSQGQIRDLKLKMKRERERKAPSSENKVSVDSILDEITEKNGLLSYEY